MRCSNTPVSAQFIIVNSGRIYKRRIANKSSSSGRSSSAYVFQIYALAICVTSRLSADIGADLVSLACHAVSRCGKKQDITNYVRSFRPRYVEMEGEGWAISHRYALAESQRDVSRYLYCGCLITVFFSCDAQVSTSCLLARNCPLPLSGRFPGCPRRINGKPGRNTPAHFYKGIERTK